MQEITLTALLEAGCHFGHKAERWHPKAASFIYAEKDGIHIIDLAKTKAGLDAAVEYIKETVAGGGEVLFVGTKRQAQPIVRAEAARVSAPFLAERWIGGFLTNWDNIHKNLEKINRMTEEHAAGAWKKKYPKHEQMKMLRYLDRIKVYYGGVLKLNQPPAVLFVVDIKKEQAAVREAIRRGVPIVAVVDTNANPEEIDYVIPANDDAVGSISFIVNVIAQAYEEGKALFQKGAELKAKADEKAKAEALALAEAERVAVEKARAEKASEEAMKAHAEAAKPIVPLAKKEEEPKKASRVKKAA